MGTHRGSDARAAVELLEPRHGVGHALEGKSERHDAAAVDSGRQLVFGNLGCLSVNGVHRALGTVSFEPVALAPPPVRPAEREHARVLAGAVVLQLAWRMSGRSALQLVLRRGSPVEQRADCGELIRVRKM